MGRQRVIEADLIASVAPFSQIEKGKSTLFPSVATLTRLVIG
jgi:hypothetical protein